ncbi:universal stress protein [Actinomycetospora sp. OC33-EN08]|uniref:Universal stress protein n=1 Tax=Actinomycetospora aurantiaca TaxID=3129233 RepID=A0ABU8MGL5_9PSEU
MKQDEPSVGTGSVVVGVDGSPGARTALDRALREAARLSAPVVAVMAYDPPDLWAMELGALPLDVAEIAREVQKNTQQAVDEAVARAREEGVTVGEVRVVAAAGSAADVLCRVARDAELLVVGHRGRGAFASRLIGSVGLGVVVHATCPVLVVRPVGAATGT